VNWIFENIALLVEIIAVILGLLFTILMAKNKISCWIFGILGSLLSIYLFIVYAKLYAEAILYGFYVIAGIYGWVMWKKQKVVEEVYSQSLKTHVKIILIGTILSLGLYYSLTYFFNDAEKPMIDSFTTVFSFIGTYLMAKKWIENWMYWLVIDAVSVYLYYTRGLEIYALLMLAYTLITIFGYWQWKQLKVIKVE
jgi:nicotinamide mononucleotide transporter